MLLLRLSFFRLHCLCMFLHSVVNEMFLLTQSNSSNSFDEFDYFAVMKVHFFCCCDRKTVCHFIRFFPFIFLRSTFCVIHCLRVIPISFVKHYIAIVILGKSGSVLWYTRVTIKCFCL